MTQLQAKKREEIERCFLILSSRETKETIAKIMSARPTRKGN